MKSVSVAPVVRLSLFVVGMVMLVSWGFAQNSDGTVSTQLAINLYCGTAALFEGDLGLLIGLILVFTGLWSLVQGGKIVAALPVLIFGALITALPSLIISSLQGLGQLLSDTGISSGTFEIKSCTTASNMITESQYKAICRNAADGSPMPSTGTPGLCSDISVMPDLDPLGTLN